MTDDDYCPKCGSCGIPDCCGLRCAYLAEHEEEWKRMRKENEALWRLWRWHRRRITAAQSEAA